MMPSVLCPECSLSKRPQTPLSIWALFVYFLLSVLWTLYALHQGALATSVDSALFGKSAPWEQTEVFLWAVLVLDVLVLALIVFPRRIGFSIACLNLFASAITSGFSYYALFTNRGVARVAFIVQISDGDFTRGMVDFTKFVFSDSGMAALGVILLAIYIVPFLALANEQEYFVLRSQ